MSQIGTPTNIYIFVSIIIIITSFSNKIDYHFTNMIKIYNSVHLIRRYETYHISLYTETHERSQKNHC